VAGTEPTGSLVKAINASPGYVPVAAPPKK
jgi:hypothetical protein